MPIVIDQFDIQPAPAASSPAPARSGEASAGEGAAPPSEQQKETELARLLCAHHERHARLRAY
jgi:hypothetical protein